MKKVLTLALLGTLATAPAFAAGQQHSGMQSDQTRNQQQGMWDQQGQQQQQPQQQSMSDQQQSMNSAPNQALDENLVRNIQQQLSQQGYNVQTDGIFGPNTQQALRQFQSQQGLDDTGQVNVQTLSALGINQQGQQGRQQPQQAQTPEDQSSDQNNMQSDSDQ